MLNDQRSATALAALALEHAVAGNLDSIQFAIIRHFGAQNGDGKMTIADPDIVKNEVDAAIELLELAAYMLRDRRADCLESLKP